MRSGVAVRVIERLHGHLEHDLVSRLPRAGRSPRDIGPIGREGKGYGGRQPRDRVGRRGVADTESSDHDGEPTRHLGAVGQGSDRASIDLRRASPVGSNLWQNAVAGLLG